MKRLNCFLNWDMKSTYGKKPIIPDKNYNGKLKPQKRKRKLYVNDAQLKV